MSTPAVSSSFSSARGSLDGEGVAKLAQLLQVPQSVILTVAVAILHFRYTGLAECDVRLRASSVSADSVAPPSAQGLPGAATLSVTLKAKDTFGDVAKNCREALVVAQGSLGGGASSLAGFHDSKASSGEFTLELFQLISQELASANFQHLVHVTVAASGTGKKRIMQVRYAWPPLMTAGQADPRVRCAEHLANIVSGMVALTAGGLALNTQPLHELQFLAKDERKRLMEEWNGNPQYEGVDRSDQLLQELFEATAKAYPQRTAIECAAPNFRSMTYEQMSRRTNQLARWMRDNGVVTGSYVGMWLPRGMEPYIALIAILKAGAAYVPMDPEYPSDRVNFILEDCKAPILITHSEQISSHADFVLPAGCQMIQYDQVDSLLEQQVDTFPTRADTGQTNKDVCYVIYTSGSTGRPKGCCLEHRSAVNLVRAERILFDVTPEDRVYQGFSIAFDASVEEVWLAFASGAALVAATPDMLHAGPGLPAMLVEQKITVISTVPTLLSMMEDTLPNVRILISGGEAVQKDLIRRWSKGRRFVNTYGPTEATVIATHIDTSPDHELVTIGKAVPSYFLYILDSNLNPCPVGVGGELHIGGLCVARGYLGREDLTKEKFIPFPSHKLWSQNRDEKYMQTLATRSPRLYKAGDLCRWTEEGNVEFCGRIDAQVKLRGYRIELSEIESVLMTQANIQSAVVSVREDVPGIQNLIGYVILKDASVAFDQDAVKEGIRVRLPPYMIPAAIDVLTKFPTLPSGKVNRKELPPPKNLVVVNYDADDADGADEVIPKNLDDGSFFPPRTALEKKLAQMWRKLFQRPRISSTDDFFTLGGHSLLAAWLVSALRKDPSTEHVTMADVYGFPKLRELACKLEGGDPSELPDPETEAREAANKPAGSEENKDASEDASGGVDDGLPDMPSGGGGGGANGAGGEPKPDPLLNFAPISNLRFLLCGLAQLASLYFLFALPALQVGASWEFYLKIREDGWQYLIIMLLPFSIALFPVYVFFAIAAKWLLIGRYREGRHRLWGWYYFRWWLVQRLVYYIPLVYLRGTPMLSLFFRAMGARIGRNVFLNTHLIEAPDLVDIGEDTSVGIDAQICNFHVEGNWLYIRRMRIGKCCYVGARSVMAGGSVMCDHSQLGAMSLLTQGAKIPPWEHWRGSPATKTARVENFMPRSVVQAGAAVGYDGEELNAGVNGGGGLNGNGHVNGNGMKLRNGNKAGFSSKSSGDMLYDEELASEVPRGNGRSKRGSVSKKGRSPNPALSSKSHTGKFLDGSLSDHLLSDVPGEAELESGGSAYVGVGEESVAWNYVRPSVCRRFMLGLGQTIVLTVLLPVIIILSLAPGFYLLHYLMPKDLSVHTIENQSRAAWQYLAAAAPMALVFPLLLCWQITIVKWSLLGAIQPGDYRTHSWFYLRKWTVDTLMQLSIQVAHPIYSTLLLVPWFRSLGAMIGDRCEIATMVYAAPDMIEVGDEVFIADTVYLGIPAVHMGTIRMAKIVVGDRVFIGNGACLPMQTMIGHGCLIGVMSAPPLAIQNSNPDAPIHWPEPALRCADGTAWLGNPAMFLPNRQPPKGTFDDSTTYNPHIGLMAGRASFEFVKLCLPLCLYILSMLLLIGDFQLIRIRFDQTYQFWLIWPLLYMSAGVGCCFVVWLLKWVLIGKYVASEHALWSSFIWRHDLVTALLDSLVHPYFITILRGTPFVSMWFRALGAQIGARAWIDTTAITEPDLVHIGDDAAVHNDAQIQTHLFEDRILKMSHLYIANKCSVGNSAVVLFDSMMHEGSNLLPLSLLMKGETLPEFSSWHGVPAHATHSISNAPILTVPLSNEEMAGEE